VRGSCLPTTIPTIGPRHQPGYGYQVRLNCAVMYEGGVRRSVCLYCSGRSRDRKTCCNPLAGGLPNQHVRPRQMLAPPPAVHRVLDQNSCFSRERPIAVWPSSKPCWSCSGRLTSKEPACWRSGNGADVERHRGASARLFGRNRLSQQATFGDGVKTMRGSRSLPNAVMRRGLQYLN
jgi:hypothetical protein